MTCRASNNNKVIHIDLIFNQTILLFKQSVLILDIRLKINYYFFHTFRALLMYLSTSTHNIVKPAFATIFFFVFFILNNFLFCVSMCFEQFIINIRYMNLELSSRQQNITAYSSHMLSYLIATRISTLCMYTTESSAV